MISFLLALSLQAATISTVNRKAILTPVNAAFAALETGDAPALLRHVYPDGRVTAVGRLAGGTSELRLSSWREYAARMKPGAGFKERITNPAIEMDGDVALVWAPFTIERDGKIVSCGYDHFDMVRQDKVWKIMNITFSSRTAGCPGR